MTANIKVGGTFQEASGIHVKVGGTWQEVLEGHIRVAGVWQQFFAGLTFTLTVTAIADTNPGVSSSAINVLRDGDLTFSGDTITGEDANEWVVPRSATVGDDYEMRMTVNSGNSPTTGTTGVWLALTSDRNYTLVRTVAGTSTGNWTLEIRRASDSVVVADTTFDISATVP